MEDRELREKMARIKRHSDLCAALLAFTLSTYGVVTVGYLIHETKWAVSPQVAIGVGLIVGTAAYQAVRNAQRRAR